jgi:hypothetical protein
MLVLFNFGLKISKGHHYFAGTGNQDKINESKLVIVEFDYTIFKRTFSDSAIFYEKLVRNWLWAKMRFWWEKRNTSSVPVTVTQLSCWCKCRPPNATARISVALMCQLDPERALAAPGLVNLARNTISKSSLSRM